MPSVAYAFADERTRLSNPVGSRSAHAHADERSRLANPVAALTATHFADERSALIAAAAPAAARAAAHFAYEQSIVPSLPPALLMVWDPALGQYVRDPWYVWNGTAWVQAL